MNPKENSGVVNGLIGAIEPINEKLPALPESAKEWIVKALPWIIIIASILMLPAVFAIFGLGAMFGTLGVLAGYTVGFSYYLIWAISVVMFVMQLSAVKGLMSRRISGWNILFYVSILSVISGIVSGSLFSAIIAVVIELYLLFQIKSYYK